MPIKLNSQGSDNSTKSHIQIKTRQPRSQKITFHSDVNTQWWSVRRRTSLLCFCRNSISWCVNVVIEMDFTLWGGFSPRLWEEGGSPALAQEQECTEYQSVQCSRHDAMFMWQSRATCALLVPHFQHNNSRVARSDRCRLHVTVLNIYTSSVSKSCVVLTRDKTGSLLQLGVAESRNIQFTEMLPSSWMLSRQRARGTQTTSTVSKPKRDGGLKLDWVSSGCREKWKKCGEPSKREYWLKTGLNAQTFIQWNGDDPVVIHVYEINPVSALTWSHHWV